MVETYAHVTPKMRASAVSKVRGFFVSTSGPSDASVAAHRVEAGVEAACDPL